MRRKKGLSIVLAMCLLLVAVLAPFASPRALSAPETSGAGALPAGTASAGTSQTGYLADEDPSVGAERPDGMPDRGEPLPAGLTVWDGVVPQEPGDCSFAGGSGTASDPYQIATPEQYVYFVMLCRYSYVDPALKQPYRSLSYVLTADLCFNPDFEVTEAVRNGAAGDLHAVPAVTPYFAGAFNGAGHRLYNIYQYQSKSDVNNAEPVGLFAELSTSATVSGLHLVRGYMGTDQPDSAPGAIAATCKGKVTGCSVSAALSFVNGGGGIAGTLETLYASVSSCVFAGELYAAGTPTTRDGVPMLEVPKAAVGGIIGWCRTPSVVTTVSDCVNRGTVSSAGCNVGGIIGSVYHAGSTVGGINISNCVNFGDVTSVYDPSTDTSYPAANKASYVGGIIGYMNRIDRTGKKVMIGVANFGNVRAYHTGSVGGILGAGQAEMGPEVVLTLQNAYNWGQVSAPDRVGGLVGHAKTRIHILDSAVFGEMTGGADVGGMIGFSEYPADYTAAAVQIDQSVMHAAVTATGGSAGGVIGTYYAGGQATLTLVGLYVSAPVTANGGIAAGFVGSIMWNRDLGKATPEDKDKYQNVTLSGTYTLLDCRLDAVGEGSATALFIGENREKTDGSALEIRGSFVKVFAREKNRADCPREIAGAGANGTAFSSEPLTDAGLTDGTYRDTLNVFAGNKGYRKWEQTAEHPMLPTIAQLALLPLSHPYNGEVTSLEDSRWSGAEIYVRYQKYDSVSGTWSEVTSAPRDAGRYRVEAAVLSLRASGALVREFEIGKQVFDLSSCHWPKETSYEYIGEEQTVTLIGLPEMAVPVYAGNRATVRGTYTAQLLSVEDPTGNYTFINLSSVPSLTWTITKIKIDFRYITWRGSTPEDPTYATTVYTGEKQVLTLCYTKNESLDLSRIMTITYSPNHEQTEAGTYTGITAKITFDERFESIDDSGDGVTQDNYRVTWEIKKREINPRDYLDFSDLRCTYDGREHTIGFTSRLPDCVTVSCDNEKKYRNAGEYTYTVHCTLTDTANNDLTEDTVSCLLTIEKAKAKITAKGRDTVYNGEEQRIDEDQCRLYTDSKDDKLRFEYFRVSEEDGSTTRLNGAPIHGGDYSVNVIFDGSDNYEEVAVTVPFYINRATLALEGDIVLRSAELLYTGEPLNLKLENERHLPDCVIPVYSAARTEPGIYKVVVNFEFTDEYKTDYQPIAGMSATMTILTSRITDGGTGVQVRFPEGSPVPYRLLVLARDDLDAFNTNWSVGFHTSLKGLWKTELKEGKNPITVTEEPFDVYLPLAAGDADDRSLTAIGLTIDEKGKYHIKVYPDAEVVDIGEDTYLKISTTEVTYFGYTTRDSASGQVFWIVLAALAAVPAAVVITVEIVRRRRKKAAGRHLDDQ